MRLCRCTVRKGFAFPLRSNNSFEAPPQYGGIAPIHFKHPVVRPSLTALCGGKAATSHTPQTNYLRFAIHDLVFAPTISESRTEEFDRGATKA
jgi:hypothetical protein